MNMINVSNMPILKRAGKEITSAKSNFLMPFAAFMRRNTRPIRNTRTTRSKVGVINTCASKSSRTTPAKETCYILQIINTL